MDTDRAMIVEIPANNTCLDQMKVAEGIYTLPKLRNRGCRKAETPSFPRRCGIFVGVAVLEFSGEVKLEIVACYIKAAYLVTGGYYLSFEYSQVDLNSETGKLYLELKWR